MAKRSNHYEAAFEEYLRTKQVPYVAVDETKRALFGNASLKSVDFIVSPAAGPSWLVDVKGRRFPSGVQNKQYWRNWSTSDDLRSLAAWEALFGHSAQGLLLFAYEVVGDRAPLPLEQLFSYQDRLYAFLGVRLRDYRKLAKRLSAAWDTLTLPVNTFREVAFAMDDLLRQPPPSELSHAHAAPDLRWDDGHMATLPTPVR